MTSYVFLLVTLTILSIIYGGIVIFVSKRKIFPILVRKLMNYSSLSKDELSNSFLGLIYYFFPLLLIVILAFLFRFPIYKLFMLQSEYRVYILVSIIAFLSVLSCISGLAEIFFPKTNWLSVISNVSWIVSVNSRRPVLKFCALFLGAFFEEVFFRGICFALVYQTFPQYSIWIPLVISSLLFGIQQSLFVKSKKEVFIFMLTGIAMGLLGGLLFMYTNSLIPSLIAHEFFVLFYFVQFDFKH
jgi:membrane protease YdiL (CAAX protease family)